MKKLPSHKKSITKITSQYKKSPSLKSMPPMGHIITVIIIMALAVSCNPYIEVLNYRGGMLYEVYNLSAIDSIEKVSDNSLYFHPGAMGTIRATRLTHTVFDITMRLDGGSRANLHFRTNRRYFDEHNRITLELGNNEAKVIENDNIMTICDTVGIKLNELHRIIIKNFGKEYLITMDCDTIYKGWTELDNTEYLALESIEGSKFYVKAIGIYPSDDTFEKKLFMPY